MKKYIMPEAKVIKIDAQEMLIALSGSEADSTYPGGGDARVLDFQDIDLGNSLDSETFDLSFDFENM